MRPTGPSDEGPIVPDDVANADPIMQTRPTTARATPDEAVASRDPASQPDSATQVATGAAPPAPVAATAPATRAVARRRRPPLQPMTEKPSGVTDEQIGAAIQRGVNWLVPRFDPKTGQLARPRRRRRRGVRLRAQRAVRLRAAPGGQSIPDERLNVRGPFMKR